MLIFEYLNFHLAKKFDNCKKIIGLYFFTGILKNKACYKETIIIHPSKFQRFPFSVYLSFFGKIYLILSKPICWLSFIKITQGYRSIIVSVNTLFQIIHHYFNLYIRLENIINVDGVKS